MQELDFQFKDIMQMEHPELILKKARPFMDLMMEYQCALMEVETKLNVLNEEFAAKYQRNPFESIKSRIKEPLSIINKMKRKGFELSVESMEKNLFDIAGIRVICSFCDDIYAIASMLTGQDDIILVDVKDYIKNPKPNGYQSLHLILDIPIFLSSGKKHMKVEVQFRTIAMDFWASLEHKLRYKKDISADKAKYLEDEMLACAQISADLDMRMQNVRDVIAENTTSDERPLLLKELS